MDIRITTTGRWSLALAGIALMAAACASTTGGAPAAESAAPTAAPAAAASAAAGSGGGRYSGGDYNDGGAYPAPSAAAGAPSAAPAAALEVKVASGAVGKFLTGTDGKTLYIFRKDSPNTSTCAADCAAIWPPVTVAADATLTAGDGAAGKLTTFARADGSMQVAYNGAPLYYFVSDQAAGDTNGQDVEDFVVAAP